MNTKCNKLIRWTTLLIAPLLLQSLPGKASPSPRPDSTLQATTRKVEKPPHSPSKATYMAMALPGLGQLYNDHWWKLPALYGGAGAAIYGYTWNNRQYTLYRDAFVEFTQYLNAKTENPELPYPKVNGWDKLFKPGGSAENINPRRFQEILQTNKNNFKRDRDLLLIVMGGIYVIQILDATVFAHFYEYEISEDLSLQLLPSIRRNAGGARAGLSLTLRF